MAVVISNYKIHEKVDPGFDKQFQKSLFSAQKCFIFISF